MKAVEKLSQGVKRMLKQRQRKEEEVTSALFTYGFSGETGLSQLTQRRCQTETSAFGILCP